MKKELKLLKYSFQKNAYRRVKSEEVLGRAGVKRNLIIGKRRRQLKCLGHFQRRKQLERDCVPSCMAGKSARGWQKMKFMTSSMEDMGRDHSVAMMV